ncbi:uncharacterized protein LOC109712916 [Ananas comosus]|uniref:Uncharacterized protein LOC109712916 n=1 Tax=Ananas comosus TaxID=4615 RepID=A0A6P5F8P2_ANACO|nr:uncharacterized protein LOC109712916 [Ananas comosus]
MRSKSRQSPSRRSKSRKLKYISISRHFTRSTEMSNTVDSRRERRHLQQQQQQQQLDLFPLHPENDRDPHVAYLLDSGNGSSIDIGAPNLTDLLGGSTASSSPASSPLDWDCGSGGVDGDGLARKALRGRERWVYCCASSSSEEEVASGATAASGIDHYLWRDLPPPPAAALSLKLDYEVILTAWSGRGSLYIDGDGPQVVPEIYHTASPVLVEVGSGPAGMWSVPEQKCGSSSDRMEEDEKVAGNREARVKRYKEKRQSRLFAKRIRYEVRKLNAEKRPRLKGRFVKMKDDM